MTVTAKNVNERDEYGYPHLCRVIIFTGAGSGAIQQITALLKIKGIDVNLPSWYEGRTPLYLAASLGYLNVVQLLVEAKADIDRKNLGWSKEEEKASSKALKKAEKAFNARNIFHSRLLDDGLKPCPLGQTFDGETALQGALLKRHNDVIEYLIAAGARKDIANAYGTKAESDVYFKNNPSSSSKKT